MDNLLQIIFEHLYGETVPSGELEAWLRPKYKELAAAVAELSAIYTRHRHRVSERLLADPVLRRAYLAYFLPCNLGKLKRILEEIFFAAGSSATLPRHLRFLDLGCGPGTHLLGLLDFLAENPTLVDQMECVAVDSISQNLQEARQLFDRLVLSNRAAGGFSQASLKGMSGDICQGLKLEGQGSFDLIVLGNVLNELFPEAPDRIERRFKLVSSLVEHWLAPRGFLVLLEPALKETSRDLLQLRDLLLEKLGLHVCAPCTHNHPCPAVAAGNESDWCHEDRPWQALAYIQKIDSMAGISKSSLKYSYAVLSRHPLAVGAAALARNNLVITSSPDPGQPQLWRVVSELMEEKGKSSAFLCGSNGRVRLTRQSKHHSESNAFFSQLARGQVVMTDGLVKKKEADWRALPSSSIKILPY